jgi:hypothetical protein
VAGSPSNKLSWVAGNGRADWKAGLYRGISIQRGSPVAVPLVGGRDTRFSCLRLHNCAREVYAPAPGASLRARLPRWLHSPFPTPHSALDPLPTLHSEMIL